MGKPQRLILAVVFAGVFLAQGLHRHPSHDGGMSAPHVDCVLCAWTKGNLAPSLANSHAALTVALLSLLLTLAAARQKDLPFSRSFNSRAPPLPSPLPL